LRNLGVDVGIILWHTLKKQAGVWTGLFWLRIGTSGGLLWIRSWTLGFTKCKEFLDNLRKYLLVSQDRLSTCRLFVRKWASYAAQWHSIPINLSSLWSCIRLCFISAS
jgi:hypothetical protein